MADYFVVGEIYIGACKQGVPCHHCLSLDRGENFNSTKGHDIYTVIKDLVEDKSRKWTDEEVETITHLRGAYEAARLLKWKFTSPRNKAS